MKDQVIKIDRPALGIFMMICFAIFGPVIDMFAKLAGETIPIVEITAARFTVQAIILIPIVLILKRCHLPDWQEVGLHLLRGLLLIIATYFFFASLQYLQIAEAIAIFFIEPLLLTLLGGILLKETIGWRRILACLVGFAGALLVIQPNYQAVGVAALYPVGTAICFAFYLILTRNMAHKIDPLTLQAYTALASVALVLPVIVLMHGQGIEAFEIIIPNQREAWLLIGVGVSATIAHLFIAFAFRYAGVAILAPLQYLEIISATLIGYVVFHQLPNLTTFIGVAIIILAGIYVFIRENQLSKRDNN